MSPISSNLSSLLSTISAACGVIFEVEDGLWISSQRPMGAVAKGLGKTINLPKLEKALTVILAGDIPKPLLGTDDPCLPIWKAVQAAYKAA
jgi:hypothetical protein